MHPATTSVAVGHRGINIPLSTPPVTSTPADGGGNVAGLPCAQTANAVRHPLSRAGVSANHAMVEGIKTPTCRAWRAWPPCTPTSFGCKYVFALAAESVLLAMVVGATANLFVNALPDTSHSDHNNVHQRAAMGAK